MGKKLTENKAFNMILSLLIALGLWVYVTSLNTNVGEITVRNIPVTIVGEEVLNSKGLMLDLGADGLTVSARVSGSRDTLVSMAMDPAQYFTATINVTEINEPGTYELSCTVASVNTLFNLTNSVQIVDRGEHIVRVTVTRLLSAQIPVQAVFEGTVDEANGYRANPAEVTPGSIAIQGPEELVSQVSYAQVVITGENLTRTYSGELGFQLMTEDGQVVDSAGITANVDTVSVVLPVVKTLELPLTVQFVYGGGVTEENFDRYVTYEISPATIQISGDEADVTPLEGSSITLGQIDLSQVIQENQTFTFPIELSPELTNDSGVTQATVTITVSGLETKTVETSNIQIINTPEGFTADAVTQSLQVQVRGPASSLADVDGYQLRVVVDLEGENLRQAQFPFTPRMYLDGDGKCGVVSSGTSGGYIVVVNIQAE